MPDAPTGDVFQPLDGGTPPPQGDNATGKPSLSAGEIAAKAAAEAVRGHAIKPGTQFQEMERVERTMESEHADRVDLPQGEEEETETQPQPQQTQETESQQQTQRQDYTPSVTMEELEAAGITLPVTPDEVPEEFRQAYDQIAHAVLDSASKADEIVGQAREALAQVQDFSERINTPEGQKRMLLTMAMSDADVFGEVMNQVQRMQDDPEYAESVRRQLEAEARYEAAVRKERVMNQQQLARKAQQIEGRTVRLANQMGVDPEWAKQEVANQILRNEAQTGKRDITLDQVDQVVNQLAARVGPRQPQQRTKSPETVQREQTAPQTQTEGAGRTPSPQSQQPRRSDVPSNEHAMDKLRSAIRSSSERMKNKGL